MEQAAALPLKRDGPDLRVLLVTSRQDGRWILPKGQIEEGETPADGAAREAFEEAGVKGKWSSAPVGTYRYFKQVSETRSVGSRVRVYPLLVRKELADWPEAKQRKRRWMSLQEAGKKVGDRSLARLLKKLGGAESRTLRRALDAL